MLTECPSSKLSANLSSDAGASRSVTALKAASIAELSSLIMMDVLSILNRP
jgi:hypothetical protein